MSQALKACDGECRGGQLGFSSLTVDWSRGVVCLKVFLLEQAVLCINSGPLCEQSLFLLQTVQVPVYSEQEYQMYLHDDAWTKAETDHLFDLSRRFDLRFVVIHDRYDHQQFKVSVCSLISYIHKVQWSSCLPEILAFKNHFVLLDKLL